MATPAHYPKRDGFFAGKFCRLMTKVCLANQIGSDGCYLLMTVAMTEDAKSYRGAVTFFNEQLLPLIGCRSVDALSRIRARCIDAGWLHYEPGGKGIPGSYWVVVPTQFRGVDNAPVDENASEYVADTTAKTRKEPREKPETSAERTATKARKKPRRSADHSSLTKDNPDPDPSCGVPPPGEPKPEKPRDEMFDFLAAVTGSDPKANGGHIARLKKLLLTTDPPHTLDEIRAFGDPVFLARELPWLNGRKPSVGELEKHIGRIRSPSSCQTKLSGVNQEPTAPGRQLITLKDQEEWVRQSKNQPPPPPIIPPKDF